MMKKYETDKNVLKNKKAHDHIFFFHYTHHYQLYLSNFIMMYIENIHTWLKYKRKKTLVTSKKGK